MKFLFILLIYLFSSKIIAQNNGQARNAVDTLVKGIGQNLGSNRISVITGPFTVDLKTMKSDTIIEEHNVYHNEQDNFIRPDSVPFHPSSLKTDTLQHNSDHLKNAKNYESANTVQTNPAVNFGFDANWCGQNTPPDNALAVSNAGYILSAINCRLDIYNTIGSWVSKIDYQTFFNTANNKFSDPRLIYDQYNDRFIFFIQYGSTSSESRIYIAFSSSNDPTQIWHYYYYDIGTVNGLAPGFWFDYPSVGINQSDFCVTGNIFNNTGAFSENILLLINKQDGYNGVSGANFHCLKWMNVTDGIGNKGFTIVPATAAQSISYDNIFYLVSTVSGGGNYVTIYTINGNATSSNSTISSANINTSQTYYPNSAATQPSGINLANTKAGCRIQCSIFLNGTVSFVFTGNYNTGGIDYNSIYYNRIEVSSKKLNQSWSFLAGSNYNYPSVASYGINSTDLASILCYLKSDAITNPEVRIKYFDNNMNQLTSTQARAGDASVHYTWTSTQRWGDYTATQCKYNASEPEVWLSGSFGNTSNFWQTYIAQITGYPGNIGISEVSLKDEPLVVYPDPVKTVLYIKGDFKNMYGFPDLYTINGTLLNIDVTRKDNEVFQVDVSRLKAGIYLIKFENSQTVKFIKN